MYKQKNSLDQISYHIHENFSLELAGPVILKFVFATYLITRIKKGGNNFYTQDILCTKIVLLCL